jgi:hypothetical protein
MEQTNFLFAQPRWSHFMANVCWFVIRRNLYVRFLSQFCPIFLGCYSLNLLDMYLDFSLLKLEVYLNLIGWYSFLGIMLSLSSYIFINLSHQKYTFYLHQNA